MPLFNNYSADGKLLSSVQEPLSEKNIERFILEQGEEKAKIYLEAMADFTADMEDILRSNGRFAPQTPHMVRTNLKLYVEDKNHFLKFVNQLVKPDAEQPKP